MQPLKTRLSLAVIAATLFLARTAHAQAAPTASQRFQLSAFVGGSGVYTQVLNGHNLSITAGADVTTRPYYGLHPSLEVRGTYPVDSGTIAGEKSILAGLKLEHQIGNFHPYANFLIGRGEIDYHSGGITVGNLTYLASTSTVFSPGLGLDYDLTPHFALKADYQYQNWTTYPLAPGVLTPSVITAAIIYRFDFNHSYKRIKTSRSTPAN